eukprot:3212788-Amphidinium_carterae.1
MTRALAMEAAIEVSDFQVKLRSRSESTFQWMDLLSAAVEHLEPELEIIIDQAWNLHGYCEKGHMYVSICLRSGLSFFESYTSCIAVSDFSGMQVARAEDVLQGGTLLEACSILRARFIAGHTDSPGGEESRACSRRPNLAASRSDVDRTVTCLRTIQLDHSPLAVPVVQTFETRRDVQRTLQWGAGR